MLVRISIAKLYGERLTRSVRKLKVDISAHPLEIGERQEIISFQNFWENGS